MAGKSRRSGRKPGSKPQAEGRLSNVPDVTPPSTQKRQSKATAEPNPAPDEPAEEAEDSETRNPRAIKRLKRPSKDDNDEPYEDIGGQGDEGTEDDLVKTPASVLPISLRPKLPSRRERSGRSPGPGSEAVAFNRENIKTGFKGLVTNRSFIEIDSTPMLANETKFNSIKDKVSIIRTQRPTPYVEPIPATSILLGPIKDGRNYKPKPIKRRAKSGSTTYPFFELQAYDSNNDVFKTMRHRKRKYHVRYMLNAEQFSESEAASVLEALCDALSRWPFALDNGDTVDLKQKALLVHIAVCHAVPTARLDLPALRAEQKPGFVYTSEVVWYNLATSQMETSSVTVGVATVDDVEIGALPSNVTFPESQAVEDSLRPR